MVSATVVASDSAYTILSEKDATELVMFYRRSRTDVSGGSDYLAVAFC